MREIKINFLPFEKQDFEVTIYRREPTSNEFLDEYDYYDFKNESGEFVKYEVSYRPIEGFSEYKLLPYTQPGIVCKKIYEYLLLASTKIPNSFLKGDKKYNRRIYFQIEKHPKGKKSIWMEPYFLKSQGKWGVLFDFSFLVDFESENEKFKLDKDILVASGTLNERGGSNTDYYLYKHSYIDAFIKSYIPRLNKELENQISTTLLSLPSYLLNSKTYIFGNGLMSNSSFLGLTKNPPLEAAPSNTKFHFIYKKEDRTIAVSLLQGLRGESSPNTFSGMNKMFRIDFSNSCITGSAIAGFTEDVISKEIQHIKGLGTNVVPIIITNSKKDLEDDELYYRLKHRFTKDKIPCQVVTKELVKNEYSLRYSLSNIGLQIFAKAGGKPWKMKPVDSEYLIIGIGQSYTMEKNDEGNLVKKNLTYSVLTDSSGIFKDIQVLGEGLENEESYYNQLIANISAIINSTSHRKISIHAPFRISKSKVIDKVVKNISTEVELSVLVINSKNDFFGFDYANNGLVPFESTFLKVGYNEYVVWFEGLQLNNPKITKRFGRPLSIKFWYFSDPKYNSDNSYKERLLQDCINLSGANWRGFKAKQLPVSVFYCQQISEFIGKFQEYHLSHIDINNLKPWFL
ncbi:Piwi domain-containing protein [Anaerocolumna jejuensis]|uniref:Piwi domain-containing protein n=1 Tax=Anaerocolumna jejuensis TaxID=259063 RepID=UPI003F7CBBC3